MNLKQLVYFANTFNIPLEAIDFHGEHDVVYLDFPTEMGPEWSTMSDEEQEVFSDTYGLYKVEGYWGFFS